MKGLDFWATDAWTDGELPFLDEGSSEFMLYEWLYAVAREEVLQALGFPPLVEIARK